MQLKVYSKSLWIVRHPKDWDTQNSLLFFRSLQLWSLIVINCCKWHQQHGVMLLCTREVVGLCFSVNMAFAMLDVLISPLKALSCCCSMSDTSIDIGVFLKPLLLIFWTSHNWTVFLFNCLGIYSGVIPPRMMCIGTFISSPLKNQWNGTVEWNSGIEYWN